MRLLDTIISAFVRNAKIVHCFILSDLKLVLINYTALAVKIQPVVQKHLVGQVDFNTIVVAIKRYSDSFEQKDEVKKESVLKNARLSLTDGILGIKFSTDDFGSEDTASLMNKFSEINPDYEFFRLADSFRVLTEDLAGIRELFGAFGNAEDKFSTGLAKIKILIPPEQDRNDVASYVAGVLHSNGIEPANAFFSQDNITIVLNEKDASRAYEILRSEIVR